MNYNRDQNGRINLGNPMWIQQPWLDQVMQGKKTVEGRVLGTNHKSKWKEGDVVLIGSGPDDRDAQQAIVQKTRHYATLFAYLKEEWKAAAPHCGSLAQAYDAYRSIMTTSKGVAEDGAALGDKIGAFDPRRVVNRGGIVAVEFHLP